MSWTLLVGVVFVLGLSLFGAVSRRRELARMEREVGVRERGISQGSAESQLQHPVVDLTRCLGCSTCVAACPEDGVLELVHGQAVVVNGARCMGYARCAAECPTNAITVTLSDLEERRDVPILNEELEAVGSPGLFLAGEVTAHTLIKVAIDHGTAVAAAVDRRLKEGSRNGEEVLDLCIVGAGPAGLACSLEAKRRGLNFVTFDQETTLGGTVANYPRRKVVMSEPVDLPLHGRIEARTLEKEEMVELWQSLATEHKLPIRGGLKFNGLERDADGHYIVHTGGGTYTARHVCLALGRRGSPRRLGVPGEELWKVAYSLVDAQSYQGKRILVVGGGDSAVEAAMGLAEQPWNQVTLSYRKESFFRIRAKNEERLAECLRRNQLKVLFQSEVVAIREAEVELIVEGGEERVTLPNDHVFVMAGGDPPVPLLERSGVSFDPALRTGTQQIGEVGSGLTNALGIGFGLSLAALMWALWHMDYYLLSAEARPEHDKHTLLRPSMGIGLWMGIVTVVLILLNLFYLVRRSPKFRFSLGSLKHWMTSHIATGILALLCALLHSAMAPRDTVGGHAFLALTVLLVTGAIGRYFYAYVPRAANGRELELEEIQSRMRRLSLEGTRAQQKYYQRVRDEIFNLVKKSQWRASFVGRVLALIGVQFDLRRLLAKLIIEGRQEGIPEEKLEETRRLARRAHRTALMAAHYEDVRAVLSSWRWLHRWVAALMVLLIVVHVAYALTYGSFFEGGGA